MHKNSQEKSKNPISEDVINEGQVIQVDQIKEISIDNQKEPKVGHIPNPFSLQSNPYQLQQMHNNPIPTPSPGTQVPQVIHGKDVVIINGAPQNVIIVQEEKKTKTEPQWKRQDRIGCCCISVHNDTYCCNVLCMDSFCRSCQRTNLCCYCHNLDCVYCCIHHACRTCCLEKECGECVLQCCKHMPICLLFDCIKNGGCNQCCGAICGCLQNCNICDLFRNCNVDCNCVGNLVGEICQVTCCLCLQ